MKNNNYPISKEMLMNKSFFLIITLLANALVAMQPVPTPTQADDTPMDAEVSFVQEASVQPSSRQPETAPMNIEGAITTTQAPASFVFHLSIPRLHTHAITAATPEQYAQRMQQSAPKVGAIEELRQLAKDFSEKKEDSSEKIVALQKALPYLPINLYEEIKATKVPQTFNEQIENAFKKDDVELLQLALIKERAPKKRGVDLSLFIKLFEKAIKPNKLEILLMSVGPKTSIRQGHAVVDFLLTRAENIPLETILLFLSKAISVNKLWVVERIFDYVQRNNLSLPQESLNQLVLMADDDENLSNMYGQRNDIVQFLINKGARGTFFSRWNNFPLHKAVVENDLELVRENIKDQDVNGIASIGGDEEITKSYTPLHLACKYHFYALAKLLIKHGADVTVSNSEDTTPLDYVIVNGYDDLLKLFIANKKFDLNEGIDGKTPLEKAIEYNQENIAKILVNHGADIDLSDGSGRTPLHQAVASNLNELAKLLIEKGANINAKDGQGETPLDNAVRGKNLEMVELLIKHGADVTIKNNQGQTALDLARTSEQPNDTLIELLQQKMPRRTIQRELTPLVGQEATPMIGLKPSPSEPLLSSQDEEESMSLEKEEEPDTLTKKHRN